MDSPRALTSVELCPTAVKLSRHITDGFPQGVNQTYQKRKILPVIFLCSGKTKMNKHINYYTCIYTQNLSPPQLNG
jgi:hypothetical protein